MATRKRDSTARLRKRQSAPGLHRAFVQGGPSSRTGFSSIALKALIAIVVALSSLLLWLRGQYVGLSRPVTTAEDWGTRRQEVKETFVSSWDAYAQHAWGQDRFHPISKRGSQMSPNGLGWIIVDSLDTLMIMNLTSRLASARLWVHRKLDYNQDQDVNTFETTIRMLGGLLSAHYLATQLAGASSRRDYVYLSKATDLADRLLGAYNSASGIPYASINLRMGEGIRSHMDGGSSSTAEATTLQMEMKYLAQLTGKEVYWRKAEKVMKVIDDIGVQDGLVPIFVSADIGRFTSREIRLGSRGDSYYEYLIKQYLQTHEPVYLKMWEESLAGIRKHLIIPTRESKLNIVAELPNGVGSKLSPKMDHLVCFLPGSIALGATGGHTEAEARKTPDWNAEKSEQMDLARELMKTCWGMYKITETGLAPEIAWFNVNEDVLQPRTSPLPLARSKDNVNDWKKDFVVKPLDAHNLQRPETVESLFLMWRITKDPIYREWGWEIFEAFKKYTVLEGGEGYTSLDNVNAIPPTRRDNMESFWLAETLKYLYLLFSPDDLLPLSENVFNTEAHVFPVMNRTKFKTGWQRKG
ncbi:glycoside hydrolase family 47 protein [Aplosporella prunicola CBS 121167]|uniref:alpha-1,2-Mannosidase n=1 Tax=Aplosporella prunicola CBS 121167 TaxID=1176127 RepID=A0A6A6ATA2_9PEZI|nr:glycoside hydrolase family 47 protein [Aplosporella prunicola CBS 121167]KAF2135199.1 glycoside hydrolase family 47 protein [Aplosporella prunicola CBS 121167]